MAHELRASYLEQGDNKVTAANWYGAKIQASNVDVKIFGAQTEICLGNRIIQAILTPRHSPGSMVYLTESDGKKIFFGQDVHGPLHPDLKSNGDDYQRSLKLMLELDLNTLEGVSVSDSGSLRVPPE